MDLQVEDKRGRSHRFTGTAFTSNPWSPWPYLFATHTFMRWELGGVVGWGEIQEVAM
jgi:hypothetical protein